MGRPAPLLPCMPSCRWQGRLYPYLYVLSDGTCTAGRNLDATIWINPMSLRRCDVSDDMNMAFFQTKFTRKGIILRDRSHTESRVLIALCVIALCR